MVLSSELVAPAGARPVVPAEAGASWKSHGSAGLEFVDLAVVLVQQSASGLHVAHAREPQLELHALVGGKSPQFLDLGGEIIGVGLGLRSVGYLALQLLDARLLLGE